MFDDRAEQAVLGAMMLSPDVAAEVEELLRAEDFYRPAHATIFTLLTQLRAEGRPTDPVAVVAALADAGDITRVGGLAYVHDLVHAVPVAAQGTHYARTVADRAVQRRLDEAGRRIQHLARARGRGVSNAELIDRAEQALAGTQPAGDTDQSLLFGELLPPALEAIENAQTQAGPGGITGIPTGFTDLDRLLGGLHDGRLYVIAGRPSMGKSTLALNIAMNAAWRHGLPGTVFTLEMTNQELVERALSAAARIPHELIKNGQLSDSDWVRLAQVAGEAGNVPIRFDDSPYLTLPDLRARARRRHRRGELRWLVVDHLALIQPGRGENRQVEVAGLSRGLKLLAKELNIPVILVAQLNRSPEQRADKRPQMSDLRESGAIEQDADVVILTHREDYYDKESPRAGEADFIVAKNRGGPTDTVTVAAQLHLSRFVDMAIS